MVLENLLWEETPYIFFTFKGSFFSIKGSVYFTSQLMVVAINFKFLENPLNN